MQITVAQWKAKAKKESHKVWKGVVLPKWKAGTKKRWTVKEEFYYIMPQSVQLTDVPHSDPRFRKLGDVHDCLAVFDDLLLEEPATVVKGELKTCCGTKLKGDRCKNKALVPDEAYYCPHHANQRNQAIKPTCLVIHVFVLTPSRELVRIYCKASF
ncbi:hypothetical protein SELMODRAFT_432309 [Selaginella moellendorffii]|uniref:Uncharacterized protein n=1 Tax=Selaginella moellendorffii TaxID=88036 RepID=D8TFL6_SELML|nr:hypothetical protein SELMODRAFT_432309 [Selaginella moellendorffii]